MNERDYIEFELGFDTAMVGQPVPDDATGLFCDGYRTGRRQHPYPQRADRYVSKWLQIRRNALRRGKHVADEITPAYIRRIDADRCPVTGDVLTHATGTGTDWSIDRCNNARGYVPGNIVVMSTRANIAKGHLAFAEIVANAARDDACDGLRPDEWQRLLALVAPAERLARGEPPPPFLTGEPYVPGQPCGLAAQVQAALFEATVTCRDDRDFADHVHRVYTVSLESKASRRGFDRLMKDLYRRVVRQGWNWDYWSLKRPQRLFIEFWVTLTPPMRAQIADRIGFLPAGADECDPAARLPTTR